MLTQLDDRLKARIQGHLAAFERRVEPPAGRRVAAVALVLLPDAQGRPAFVLTRRSGSLRHHGGQFALPGGRLEAGETAVEAARRELWEEVGVDVDDDAVLGALDDFATRSGFVITPVVLWAPDVTELLPDPDEVAVAYRVPLRELYDERVPTLWPMAGSAHPCLSLPLVGTYIHSPTAAMIYQLREVALEGRDTRVFHYEQPRFAWK